MGRILVLPEHVANQIAAGEVVERPASVVKELVENAIDAGATRIAVAIERGGKELVRVEDDGSGLEASDVPVAFERHATSKLTASDDLRRIVTLGFRGEALPSIASVSRLWLATMGEGAASGTRIEIEGGRTVGVEPVAFTRGTTVEVRDLFYNVPARLKFLKATGAETGACTQVVLRAALTHPEVGFTLTSGGRTLLEAPGAAGLRDRVRQLFGAERAARLLEIERDDSGMHLRALLDLPERSAQTRSELHVLVNGRAVVDRMLQHAVIAGYEGLVPSGRFPTAFLAIDVDPEEVDVNVHPAKMEVRFADGRRLHHLVSSAVREALGRGGFVPSFKVEPSSPAAGLADRVREAIEGSLHAAGGGGRGGDRPYAIHSRSFVPPPPAERPGADAGSRLFPLAPGFPAPVPGARRTSDCGLPEDDGEAALRPEAARTPGGLHATAGLDGGAVRVLGQFRSTFVVAADARGLLLVDQHTAHERVLFERLKRERAPGGSGGDPAAPAVQRLLVPEVIELPPALAASLAEHRTELALAGIEVEPMGGRAFAVRALPAATGGIGARVLVERCLGALAGAEEGGGPGLASDRVVATIACHAAVKVNMPLLVEKMEWLLGELFLCADPYRCPHGRTTVLRLEDEAIKRSFGRYW